MNMLNANEYRVLSSHQPNYWPYPGLIGKIIRADRFMYMSNVQVEKQSWQMRNRIRTTDGWSYIRVPVYIKGKFGQRIMDVEIDNTSNWCRKTKNMIQMCYSKAKYYDELKDFIDDVYSMKWTSLNELDIYIMNYILEILDVQTEILYDTDYDFEGKKTELLMNYCEKLDCDMYISNLGSAAYVQINEFNAANIDHIFIDYKPVTYEQCFPGCELGLSILDMLMNCGTKKTREILMDDDNFRFSKLNEELV